MDCLDPDQTAMTDFWRVEGRKLRLREVVLPARGSIAQEDNDIRYDHHS